MQQWPELPSMSISDRNNHYPSDMTDRPIVMEPHTHALFTRSRQSRTTDLTFTIAFVILSRVKKYQQSCHLPKESQLIPSCAKKPKKVIVYFCDYPCLPGASNARCIVDVKQMPNKDGSGKGQMAAWKVSHAR